MSRFRPRVNVVYTAEQATLVTAQYAGGWSGTVTLLVGGADTVDPPGIKLGELTSAANSSLTGLVQPGERWTLASTKDPTRGGVICWATPL